PDLVVGVNHGEAGLQLRQLGMPPQDLRRDGVEGAEPSQAFGFGPDQRQRSVTHLPRRLVGEGDDQQLRRPRLFLREDVRHAGGQDARLARAGAGQHQQRAFGAHHRFALLGVEPLQIIVAGRPAARRTGARAFRNRPRVLLDFWDLYFRLGAETLFRQRWLLTWKLIEGEVRRRASFRNRGVVVRPRLALGVGERNVTRLAGFVHSALIWRGVLASATLAAQHPV